MPLLDSMMHKLELFCQQEDTQKRLRHHLLEPAAAFVMQRMCRYVAPLALLLLVQIVLLVAIYCRLSCRVGRL